ncbi:hypothetical protein Bpfe_005886 [Biomphalaria pfeifferi]|uniref:Uncharacterized protein n=1 Tax=Biomphalaria pfeifferi TaxID=112525 RepID=A0AAD8C1K5_BIOPF|nr:hypothetical protein Bpfe_005886 [Biomphalaria pfeifferi]
MTSFDRDCHFVLESLEARLTRPKYVTYDVTDPKAGPEPFTLDSPFTGSAGNALSWFSGDTLNTRAPPTLNP